MLLTIVFLVSFAALAFEVLLTRIFSIAQWHHLTFMVISTALFGFAASGTCLGIMESRASGWVKKLTTPAGLGMLATGYTFSTIIVFLVLGHLPLNYFRLPIEPIQTFYLAAVYFLPAIPFFIAGLTISLAYAHQPKQSGWIYFVNMAGSALGAVFPILFLSLLREEQLLVLTAFIPMAILFVGGGQRTYKNASGRIDKTQESGNHRLRHRILSKTYRWILLSVGVLVIAAAFSPRVPSFFRIRPTAYKDLSRIRQFPDTRIIDTANGIRGRIDMVESPYLRYAPGLSLKWTEPVSARLALFKDGDGRLVLYEPTLAEARRWAPYTLSWAGYLLANHPQRILLFIQNGGTAIACATAADPSDLTVVVDHPVMAKIMGAHYQRPVTAASSAGFLAQSQKRYDIIHVENWGGSLAGTAALTQDHAFSIEQFDRYLDHLTSDGVLVFTRRLKLPPADIIRLWATAFLSLQRQGVTAPTNHLAILRSWDTFTLIVSIRPLKSVDTLKEFARDRNFDPVFLPKIKLEDTNRFNRFDRPYYYLEIDRLARAYRDSDSKTYFDAYLLDATPQSDRRPFPNRYLKWTRLREIYQTTGSRFYTLFLSGEIIVSAVLIEAILISLFLLILPALILPAIPGQPAGRLRIIQAGYFLAVGAGFILSEIYFIRVYTHIFGDPLISFTFVLTGLLIFSSIGGFFSQRLPTGRLTPCLAVLIGLLSALFLFHDPLAAKLLSLSLLTRYATAGLLLLSTGFLMGLTFPIGMRDLLKSPTQRARAWAINGCASVVSAVAAAQIALTAGIPILILIAALSYAIALLCLIKIKHSPIQG